MAAQLTTKHAVAAAEVPLAVEDCEATVQYTRKPRKPFLWFSLEQKPLIRKATGIRRTKVAVVKGRTTKRADALSNKVAEAWRSLSPKQKAKYQKKWLDDKIRFERDIADGMVPKPANVRGAGKAKASADDLPRPKKTVTAYFQFVKRNAERVGGGLNGAELHGALGKEYKALSAAEKQVYEDLAKADCDRYHREMTDYRTMVSAGLGKVVKRPTRGPSAFCRFLKTIDQKGKFTMESSKRWQALPAAEKQKFRDEEREDLDRFAADMKAFKAYQVSVRGYTADTSAIAAKCGVKVRKASGKGPKKHAKKR